MIYAGVHGALSMHVYTFFWELETNGIEYAQYGGIFGGLTGLAAIGLFHRKFDKRMTVIMGVVLTYATMLVLFNLAVDVLYRWIDPRIQL